MGSLCCPGCALRFFCFTMLPTLGSWRRSLILASNKIGDAGAEKLAAAMPSMAKLELLQLGSNKIGDAGAEKLAAAMPSMPNLVDLDHPIGAHDPKQKLK